ncbi:MAG: hypothetical protein CL570_04835 [Alphaproteobacteria bacterium]|nr:hypothetical protein [Alphaproteobacteria bacterium]|tara:strand:- start:17745 stop:18035 length:291 start_codon:yes stop_codon:yes gene_type:complete
MLKRNHNKEAKGSKMYNFRSIAMFFAMCAVFAGMAPLMSDADGQSFGWMKEGYIIAQAEKQSVTEVKLALGTAQDVALIEPAAGDQQDTSVLQNWR